jgi:hypothetical protein
VSGRKKKRKGTAGLGPLRGKDGGCWAAGPKGRRVSFSLFFLFFFKLFSNQTFPFKFKPKFFKPFYKIL